MRPTIQFETVPVLGMLRQQPPELRPTDFMEFMCNGVNGLARVRGTTLEILAVVSEDEGKGHFRNFIDQCKKHYAAIRFWAVMNPRLETTLRRYRFYGGHDLDEFGDMVDVMDWSK